MKRLIAFSSLLCFLTFSISPVYAKVELGPVGNGEVSLQQEGSVYTVTATDNAIADFTQLSITTDEVLNFNLPSATSSMLNRVIGSEASEFLGSIFSNGNIFIINPNGIHFGSQAVVNVQSLVASTLNLSNENFLAGNYALARDPSLAAGFILNEGEMTAARDGFVALVGGAVQNTGKIIADGGSVQLVGADRVTLGIDGGNLISVEVQDPIQSEVRDLHGNVVKDLISNSGTIQANGGSVVLSAKAAEEVFDSIINHTGIIEAKSLEEENGRIFLTGGDEGIVQVSGKLDASGKNPGEHGGTIEITGERLNLANGAKLDVSGDQGGGSILVGGDLHGKGLVPNARETLVAPGVSIKADALFEGNGGRVILWSDETTRYYGSLSAQGGLESGDGGFAEISGKENLDFRGAVNLKAPQGISGTLLLDPSFMTVTDTLDGTGNLDDELTPGSDSELLADVPDDPVFNSVSRGQLEAFGSDANLILETTGLLRVRDIASNVIGLAASTGSIRLAGQSITFNDPNDVIRTEGGSITAEALLSQGKITGGGFDTTGADGTHSGNIFLKANTDISVTGIKTGGGELSVEADFDKGGTAGIFTLPAGKSISTAGGLLSIIATDVVLNGTVNAGDITLVPARGGTIGIGNTVGAMTLDGAELANITANSLAVGNHLNDSLTVDGVNAAQSENISSVTLNVTKPNRDILFENNPSTFNSLTVNSAQDILLNQPLTTDAGGLTLKANHHLDLKADVTTAGETILNADAEGNGSGDLFLNHPYVISTNNHPLKITANDIDLFGHSKLNSGTATTTILVSDGGTINLGDSSGNLTLFNDELQDITSNGFIVGDNTNGNVTLNGISENQSMNLGDVILNATAPGSSILLSGNGSHFGHAVTLNAANGVTVNKNLAANGSIILNADSDASGVGDLIVSSGMSFTSHGNPIEITANDLQIDPTAHFTSGDSSTAIHVSDGGTIRLGAGTGDMTIDGAELQTLKARDLVIGDSANPSLTVDGISTINTQEVFNSLTLNATGAAGTVNFENNPSSFNFLTANAGNGVSINTGLTMDAGDFSVNADSDASGAGNFAISPAGSLTTFLDHSVGIKAANVQLDGTITTGRTGSILLEPIFSTETVGLNNSTGDFNLTAAELNHLTSAGPEPPNSMVTIGRSDGTGQIDLSSLGVSTITNPYHLTLLGGDIVFHNRLTLANNMTLTLDGGQVIGSALGRDVNITGGTGTLFLNTSGPVHLDTLIDRLGPSTVGGDLSLINHQTLNVPGVVDINGGLNLTATRELGIHDDFTTAGPSVITADSDRNGSGNFVLGTNAHIVTSDHPLQITANDYVLTSGGSISSGAADTTLLISDGGSLHIGQGVSSSDATITHNEYKLITAGNLIIGDDTNGDLTVTGLTETITGHVAGTTTLNATGVLRSVNFSGGGSTFQNALAVNAGNGINLTSNLKTLDAGITLNADSDASGTGDLTITDNNSINSNHHSILVKANDIHLNTTGAINSNNAPTTILISDGGTIGIGNAVGDMTISGSEFERLKATGLTIGDNTNSDITVDGITGAQSQNITGALTLNATGVSRSVYFSGADSTFNALAVNAGNGITTGVNLTSDTGGITLRSDSDDNGTGDLTVLDGATINSGSQLLDILTNDLHLNNTGALASIGEILLTARGDIGLGGAPGDLDIDSSEYPRMTAGTLRLNAPKGDITVGNAAGTSGTTILNAADKIEIQQSLTNAGGFLALTDFDNDGIGNFSIASGGELRTFLGHGVEITTVDLDLNGNIHTGRNGTVLLQPVTGAAPIGLNDASADFNLTEAELNHLISSGPETPNVSVTLGRAANPGEIQIGLLGPIAVTEPYNLTLLGADIIFNDSLALADNHTLSLIGAVINGPAATAVEIGGGAGTLLLNSLGSATLNTSIDRLGASTVGGDLKIANDKDLAVTGFVSTQAANGNMEFDVHTNTFTMSPGSKLKSGTGDITITGNGIDLNGGSQTVVSLGELKLQPGDPGASIGVAGGAGTLQLTDTDFEALHEKDFEHIYIGRPDSFGAITINAVTFFDPVTFLSPAAGGSITVNGLITSEAPVIFEGSGNTTTLNAGIATEGYDIIFDDSVILGTDVTLSTVVSADRLAHVEFNGSLNGPHNLIIKGGKGHIVFNGPVGDTAPIGTGAGYAMDLSTKELGFTHFNDTLETASGIHTTGLVKFTEEVTLGNGDTVTALDDKVIFDGLDFHASDGAHFGSSTSDLLTLASGPVSITSDSSPLIFNGWLNGAQDLTVDSGTAETKFMMDVGTQDSLDTNRIGDGTGLALNLLSTGPTTFERLRTHSGIHATGPVTFHRDVIIGDGDTSTVLKGNVILSSLSFTAADGATFGDSISDSITLEDDNVTVGSTGSPLIFNAPVDGTQNLQINSGTGQVDFNAPVGSSVPLGKGNGLSLNSNTLSPVFFNGTLTANSGIKTAGPVTFKESVTLGAGDKETILNGDVTLDGMDLQSGGNVNFGNSQFDQITVTGSNSVHTTADGANLNFHGAVNGTGDLNLTTQGLGNITFDRPVGNAVPLNSLTVNAANNANFLNILGTDITAGSLAASAATGIGTALDPLLTAVGKLEAFGGTGGVFITNTGALAIGGVSSLIGVSAAGLPIQIFSASPITVNELVTQTGGADITLASLGANAVDDLTLNANVEASGGNGNITLVSGDTTAIGSGVSVKTSGSGNINISAGEDFTDGVLNQNGTVTGDIVMSSLAGLQSQLGNLSLHTPRDIAMTDGAIANGGSGKIDFNAGRDIALASAETTSNATDAVILKAGGALTDAGDTDPEIVTGSTGTTTLTAGTGIGSLNPLETVTGNLSAITDTGNLRIHNTGALNIVDANGVNGVSIADPFDLNGGSFIEITTASPLALNAAVTNDAAGDITLSSLGSNPADDLTLGANVITTGKISLNAGDAVSQTGGILSGNALELNAGTVSLEKTGNDVDSVSGISHGFFSFVDSDDLAIGQLNAGTGSISLVSGGALTDANGALNNFTAGALILNAVTGIGSGDAFETAVSSINLKNTTSGNIAIDQMPTAGNLDINQVDQQGAGNVAIRTLGSSDLNLNGNVTTTGNIEVTSGHDIAMTDGKSANAGSGKIKLDANRNIKLSSLKTTSDAADAVIVKATNGEITDGGDADPEIVTGSVSGTATLIAKKGIGSANPLETVVRRLSAVTDNGNLRIHNTGALEIVNANAVNGVSIVDPLNTNNGDYIEITSASPVTVNSPVTNNAGGDILIASLGANPADDLAVNANVGTNGGNGNINLIAGDSISMAANVVVSALKKGNIKLAAGEDYTDGVFDQDGNTGPEGGDIVMTSTSKVATEDGNITLDAADDLALGVADANSNNDKIRGNVNTFSRAGVTTDTNGKANNIKANNLVMISSGNIGTKADPIEIGKETRINKPSWTSFPQCVNSKCSSQRYTKT